MYCALVVSDYNIYNAMTTLTLEHIALMTMSWWQKIICVEIMIATCIYCISKSLPISGMMNIVNPSSQMETICILDVWLMKSSIFLYSTPDRTYVQRNNKKKRYCDILYVIDTKRLGTSLTRYSTNVILYAFDFNDSTLFIYFTFQFLRWSVARGAPVGRK